MYKFQNLKFKRYSEYLVAIHFHLNLLCFEKMLGKNNIRAKLLISQLDNREYTYETAIIYYKLRELGEEGGKMGIKIC